MLALCRNIELPYCLQTQEKHSVLTEELLLDADRELVGRYEVISATQSPECVAAWREMVCSETFFRNSTAQAACKSTCRKVARMCVGLACSFDRPCTQHAECKKKKTFTPQERSCSSRVAQVLAFQIFLVLLHL